MMIVMMTMVMMKAILYYNLQEYLIATLQRTCWRRNQCSTVLDDFPLLTSKDIINSPRRHHQYYVNVLLHTSKKWTHFSLSCHVVLTIIITIGLLIWFELIIMIKNSGLTVFGSTCLTPSISPLLSSSSPSVRCKHHCKTPLLWGRHHCSDLWSQSSEISISMLITITNINHDHWSHGDDHRHESWS